MRAYGPPQIDRYRAEDFSKLVKKIRRLRKAGKHRRATLLH